MRSLHYTIMACAAAAVLTGCATTDDDWDHRGAPPSYDGVIYDERTYEERTGDPILDGLNRGVNTNYFGPVNSGAEAARGVGTASGRP